LPNGWKNDQRKIKSVGRFSIRWQQKAFRIFSTFKLKIEVLRAANLKRTELEQLTEMKA
jgi:hypothetical protein